MILLSGGAVSLVWFLYAHIQFGRITPNAVAVKAGRFMSPERSWQVLTSIGKILGSTNSPELALMAVALVMALLAKRYSRTVSSFHLAALGWLVALPCLYIARDVQVVSRYLVPVLPVVVLYGFLSLRWVGEKMKLSRQALHRAVWVFSAVCVTLNLSVLAFVAYPHTHSFSRDLRGSLIHLGKWFSENTPANTTVAIPDIGAFAFYSDRKVVDLGGLVTPEMIPILRDHELDEVLTRFLFSRVALPDYVVDRARSPRRLLGVERLQRGLLPVVTTSVSSLGITRPGRFYYTAYRIEWDKLDSGLAGNLPVPGGN